MDDVNNSDEYKKAVIIGSCSATIPIIICLSVVLRKCKSHRKSGKRCHHKSTYILNRPKDKEESSSYDTIEVEESYDPDLYENTITHNYIA